MFTINGGVSHTGNACSGDYKLIEDSFLLSGQREDNMAKLWWACQDDYGKTVSCSKTFDYKCVKNNGYKPFTNQAEDDLIPQHAKWNNNVLPNTGMQVSYSGDKRVVCSFSCEDGYSWEFDNGNS